MTERERLVELIKNAQFKHLNLMWCEAIMLADELLENGVIVPPCKVGDMVYYVEGEIICKGRIDKIEYNLYTDPRLWIEVEYRSPIIGTQIARGRVDLLLNKIVFFTREEAEKALKERRNATI